MAKKRAASPTEVFAKRLREVRDQKGWSGARLAEAVTSLGVKMDRSAILKIENGARGVSIDEVFLFAMALDVSPLWLTLPPHDEPMQVGHVAVAPVELRPWARNETVLHAMAKDPEREEFFYDHRDENERRQSRRFPGLSTVRAIAGFAAQDAGRPDATIDDVLKNLDWLARRVSQEQEQLRLEGGQDGDR